MIDRILHERIKFKEMKNLYCLKTLLCLSGYSIFYHIIFVLLETINSENFNYIIFKILSTIILADYIK
mgnify:CR=1 FL=1